jgi:hypothetical protein
MENIMVTDNGELQLVRIDTATETAWLDRAYQLVDQFVVGPFRRNCEAVAE